ncbi:MAG TPA: fumarate hydratase [Coriobacteriia bacterium]|nr:fumarate hydratase [Coriobacteriia bacterium]
MLSAQTIGAAVRSAISTAACELRPDVDAALRAAARTERSERGRAVLRQLVDNAELARTERVPLCQDTGTVWVRVELGSDQSLTGNVQTEVNAAIAEAYREAGLRMSLVNDALLDRSNTGDNTPGFVDLVWRPGTGATVQVMLKGGGSDNASRIEMLAPDAGFAGIKRVVLETVETKATGACPPLLMGVGVGATFDKVGGLAKRALLREIGSTPKDDRIAVFEAELLAAVNELGIGPAGLGGDTTALAVHIVTAPCHIAALPVAVNMGCCAVLSATVEIEGVR